jgi:hypothetical protein
MPGGQVFTGLCAGQSSYARRNQAFNADQARAKLSDDAMAKLGLPIPHGVMVQTSADAASFWAARRTISGWWLGRGLTLNDHGFVDVWYYSGADEPRLGPSEAPTAWGGRPNQAPPDWQGGDD